MTLIILLIVLITERVALQGTRWQVQGYIDKYISLSVTKPLLESNTVWHRLLLVFAPATIVFVLLQYLGGGLIEFIVSLFILGVCIGDARTRLLYRKYLNALSRKDEEAQYLIQQQLRGTNGTIDIDLEQSENQDADHQSQVNKAEHIRDEQETLGETLIWINFKYYAAPIFYFVVLGLPGIIAYCTLLHLVESNSNTQVRQNKQLALWLEWFYWLPSRLVSLGFMIVGNFSNGLETWLRYAANVSKPSREMLSKVALRAESVDGNLNRNNAIHMVKLTKRNVVLFLVVVALLTLYGQIV